MRRGQGGGYLYTFKFSLLAVGCCLLDFMKNNCHDCEILFTGSGTGTVVVLVDRNFCLFRPLAADLGRVGSSL